MDVCETSEPDGEGKGGESGDAGWVGGLGSASCGVCCCDWITDGVRLLCSGLQ